MLPFIFETKYFILYTYPLIVGIAWGVSYDWTNSVLKRNGVEPVKIKILFFGSFLSAWFGAKLFFLFYSAGNYLQKLSLSFSFWVGGGMVFYGGLIFATLFVFVFSIYLKKIEFKKVSLTLPILAFCHGIGRLACLAAGCCYGSETNFPLTIHLHNANRHPVQLYESICLFVLSYILFQIVKKKSSTSELVLTYFIGYSVIRFLLEFLRGDKIRGIHAYNLSTSQGLSLFIFCLSITFIIFNKNSLKFRSY
ncbi:MAG: prolipoprotein diacylglyceryl transferase [Halobacteriovoraceae bacterium]|nr:prolipoprotein diacylglyceryl transferase [Halobacteriovoraceae bacterium]